MPCVAVAHTSSGGRTDPPKDGGCSEPRVARGTRTNPLSRPWDYISLNLAEERSPQSPQEYLWLYGQQRNQWMKGQQTILTLFATTQSPRDALRKLLILLALIFWGEQRECWLDKAETGAELRKREGMGWEGRTYIVPSLGCSTETYNTFLLKGWEASQGSELRLAPRALAEYTVLCIFLWKSKCFQKQSRDTQ
jgi:hypothetical protein